MRGRGKMKNYAPPHNSICGKCHRFGRWGHISSSLMQNGSVLMDVGAREEKGSKS